MKGALSRYWLSVATNGKDRQGLKLEKFFFVFNAIRAESFWGLEKPLSNDLTDVTLYSYSCQYDQLNLERAYLKYTTQMELRLTCANLR